MFLIDVLKRKTRSVFVSFFRALWLLTAGEQCGKNPHRSQARRPLKSELAPLRALGVNGNGADAQTTRTNQAVAPSCFFSGDPALIPDQMGCGTLPKFSGYSSAGRSQPAHFQPAEIFPSLPNSAHANARRSEDTRGP